MAINVIVSIPFRIKAIAITFRQSGGQDISSFLTTGA